MRRKRVMMILFSFLLIYGATSMIKTGAELIGMKTIQIVNAERK